MENSRFAPYEVKWTEKLVKLTEKRVRLLEKVRERVPHEIFEKNVFFHSFLIFLIVAVVFSVFHQLRKLNFFAFHPVLMSIGTFGFIAEGVVAHANHTMVDILGPIMQHNRKVKIRVIHQNLHMIGSSFMGLGLLFMFANKFVEKKSMIPSTPHALLGWAVLLGIMGQAFVGTKKLQVIDIKGASRPYRWHGDAGLLVWDGLCITALLGMLEFFEFTLMHLCLELCVFVAWWIVHLQLKTKGSENTTEVLDSQETQAMLGDERDEITPNSPPRRSTANDNV
jgi:hypothetical protein